MSSRLRSALNLLFEWPDFKFSFSFWISFLSFSIPFYLLLLLPLFCLLQVIAFLLISLIQETEIEFLKMFRWWWPAYEAMNLQPFNVTRHDVSIEDDAHLQCYFCSKSLMHWVLLVKNKCLVFVCLHLKSCFHCCFLLMFPFNVRRCEKKSLFDKEIKSFS